MRSENISRGTEFQRAEGSLSLVGNRKPPVHARRFGEFGSIGTPAASSRINGFVVIIIGRTRCLLQVLARTRAGINETAIAQPSPCIQIGSPSFTLRIGTMRTTAVRTFTPSDSEPSQIVDHDAD